MAVEIGAAKPLARPLRRWRLNLAIGNTAVVTARLSIGSIVAASRVVGQSARRGQAPLLRNFRPNGIGRDCPGAHALGVAIRRYNRAMVPLANILLRPLPHG